MATNEKPKVEVGDTISVKDKDGDVYALEINSTELAVFVDLIDEITSDCEVLNEALMNSKSAQHRGVNLLIDIAKDRRDIASIVNHCLTGE